MNLEWRILLLPDWFYVTRQVTVTFVRALKFLLHCCVHRCISLLCADVLSQVTHTVWRSRWQRDLGVVCGRSSAAGGLEVCGACCVLSLRRTYRSSRGVLPNVVCRSVISKLPTLRRPSPLGLLSHKTKHTHTVQHSKLRQGNVSIYSKNDFVWTLY